MTFTGKAVPNGPNGAAGAGRSVTAGAAGKNFRISGQYKTISHQNSACNITQSAWQNAVSNVAALRWHLYCFCSFSTSASELGSPSRYSSATPAHAFVVVVLAIWRAELGVGEEGGNLIGAAGEILGGLPRRLLALVALGRAILDQVPERTVVAHLHVEDALDLIRRPRPLARAHLGGGDSLELVAAGALVWRAAYLERVRQRLSLRIVVDPRLPLSRTPLLHGRRRRRFRAISSISSTRRR